MTSARLSEMKRGWFVGRFAPTLFDSPDAEVAVKRYAAGDFEPAHLHKVATEITVIVSGRVRMFGREWTADDIIIAEPGEATSFEALEDSVTAVVKIPCVAGDKYPVA